MRKSFSNILIACLNDHLRLADNPALYHAAQNGIVLPVYILDEAASGQWKMNLSQRWWLHESLTQLQRRLAQNGTPLVLRKGPIDKVLADLVKEVKASGIYYNRRFDIPERSFEHLGVEIQNFNASLLTIPGEITPAKGGFFKVFTPFWNSFLKTHEPEPPLPIPQLTPLKIKVHSEDISEWGLLSKRSPWQQFWIPGEEHAQVMFRHFLEQCLIEYPTGRDLPAESLTSKMSPYLRFGEISIRQIWHAIRSWQYFRPAPSKNHAAEHYLRELGWREFCYQLLHFFPQLPTEPFNSRFATFGWEDQPSHLKRWQAGLTGYPIVDAGMRQLAASGWMHNRVRMIVASFLTKDLMIPWQQGAQWFWENLLDADLANNSANWQWVAGCGADAAPFFRIFNPVLQSEKFDPQARYLHQWVPELARLRAPYCHTPWKAPEHILLDAGIKLGKDYPLPMVNHAVARKSALDAFERLRSNENL